MRAAENRAFAAGFTAAALMDDAGGGIARGQAKFCPKPGHGLASAGHGPPLRHTFPPHPSATFPAAGTVTTYAAGVANPVGVAFDPAGNLYASDFAHNSVFKIVANGVTSTATISDPSVTPALLT